MGSGGENQLSVYEIDISRNKTTNIIVMVLSENYNTSKLFIYICYCWIFPSNTDNITRQQTSATGKVILNATLVHYKSHTYASLHQAISIPAYTLNAHNSYIGIVDYRYIIMPILCHNINTIGDMID